MYLLPIQEADRLPVDILFIHIQAWIIWVQGCHEVITAHRSLTDKVNICRVDLIDIQASILTAKGFLPFLLVPYPKTYMVLSPDEV